MGRNACIKTRATVCRHWAGATQQNNMNNNNTNTTCPRNAMTWKINTTKGRTAWDQATGIIIYRILSPIEQGVQSTVKGSLPDKMLLQAPEVVTWGTCSAVFCSLNSRPIRLLLSKRKCGETPVFLTNRAVTGNADSNAWHVILDFSATAWRELSKFR